jgi:hypothetical protein
MLRTPEARLYRSSWADGSLDLVSGIGLIVIGIGYSLDLVVLTAMVPPLGLVAWLLLRSRVIEPRIGRIEWRGDRRERTARETAATAVIGVVALLIAVGAMIAVRANGLSSADAVDGLPAVLTALLALAAAVLTRSPRFAWYAALLVVGGVLTVVLGTGPDLPLVICGGVAATVGGVLLARVLALTSFEDDA